MIKITIICLGKLKETAMQTICNEYAKRLKSHCQLNIIELPPHSLSDNPTAAQISTALEKEAAKITAQLPNSAFICPLCIEGDMLSSESLACKINQGALSGKGHFVFIIGSSHGLAPSIKQMADFKLSLSRMTFAHQFTRMMLLEQIYRAFQINTGGKYHK